MKNQPADKWLQSLENLQEVNPPSDLFGRISQTIAERQNEWLSAPKVLATSMAFVLLVSINIIAALQVNASLDSGENNNTQTFITDNNLYK